MPVRLSTAWKNFQGDPRRYVACLFRLVLFQLFYSRSSASRRLAWMTSNERPASDFARSSSRQGGTGDHDIHFHSLRFPSEPVRRRAAAPRLPVRLAQTTPTQLICCLSGFCCDDQSCDRAGYVRVKLRVRLQGLIA